MKTCDVQGCTDPVFGTDKNTKKRFCKKHQWMRTDTIKSIKHKSVKQRNEKSSRNKIDFDIQQWGFDNETDMFEWIWQNRPHISEISKKDLNKVLNYFAMFAHILPKGKYPLFRYNPENIILVRPLEHVLIDQGSASARANYVKENPSANFAVFYERKAILLSEYPKEKKYATQELET